MQISPPFGYKEVVPFLKTQKVRLLRAGEVPEFAQRGNAIPISHSEFQAAARDYARMGQFILEGAQVQGQSILPEGWLPDATTKRADIGKPGRGYGYQWWTYPGGNFGGQGIFGQSVTLLPEQGVVVAIVSSWPKATERDRSMARLALMQKIAAAAD